MLKEMAMMLEKSDTGDIASKTLADRVWLLRLNLCQEHRNLKVIPQTLYASGFQFFLKGYFLLCDWRPPLSKFASHHFSTDLPSLICQPLHVYVSQVVSGSFFGLSSAPHVSLHFFPISSPPSFYVCFSIMCFPISQQLFFFVCPLYSCVSQSQSPFLMVSGSFICLIFVSHHLLTEWLAQFLQQFKPWGA